MNRIGYWITSLKDEEFCAPQEVVGFLPQDVRTKIADYLDAGSIDLFNSGCGYAWCRFFCGVSGEEMGSRELTDGCWIWPEGLSHYVRAHGIVLPDEFMAHAVANVARDRTCDETLEAFTEGPAVLDYWRKWCAGHRSPTLLERLRQARTRVDAQARGVQRVEIQRMIVDENNRHGLGHDRCIFVNCEERVLSGMKLCARHFLRDTEHITDECYAIKPEFLA